MKTDVSACVAIRRSKPLCVIANAITLVAFLFNMVCVDLAYGADAQNPAAVVKELRAETLNLPEYLGQIKDRYHGSEKIIIHIQDAHCNYAAQHKINDIIEYLNIHYGIEVINLEGGSKDYDLSMFTRIADANVREKVADTFVKDGLVNGAEYFAINNPEKATLWGVEDVNLYVENLNVYRESLKYKDTVDRYLNSLNHILSNLKPHIYSQELLELDSKYGQYKAGNLEFKEYLNYLLYKAKQKSIDIKTLTNMYLLNQTLDQESKIDFKRAGNERDKLIDLLQKILSKRELEELVLKTLEYKSEKISQADFYAYLTKKAKSVNLQLDLFPELNNYIVYISMYQAIDKHKVMEEMETLEEKLKESMYQNDTQKTLVTLSKNLSLLKNIFSITLTKDDYKYYLDNEESFNVARYVAFINKQAPIYKISAKLDKNISELDTHRNNITKFYEYSLKRDDVFLKNIKFGQKNSAVIVTGGFHTENLLKLFKDNNISYISIMPNFRNDDGYESPYFSLLAGELTGIEKRLYSVMAQAGPSVAASTMQIGSMLSPAMRDEIWKRGLNYMTVETWLREQVIEGKKGISIRLPDGTFVSYLYSNDRLERSDGKVAGCKEMSFDELLTISTQPTVAEITARIRAEIMSAIRNGKAQTVQDRLDLVMGLLSQGNELRAEIEKPGTREKLLGNADVASTYIDGISLVDEYKTILDLIVAPGQGMGPAPAAAQAIDEAGIRAFESYMNDFKKGRVKFSLDWSGAQVGSSLNIRTPSFANLYDSLKDRINLEVEVANALRVRPTIGSDDIEQIAEMMLEDIKQGGAVSRAALQISDGKIAMGKMALSLLQQMAENRGYAMLPMMEIVNGVIVNWAGDNSVVSLSLIARSLIRLGMRKDLAEDAFRYYLETASSRRGVDKKNKKDIVDFLLQLAKTLSPDELSRAQEFANTISQSKSRDMEGVKLVGEIAKRILSQMDKYNGNVLIASFIEMKNGRIRQKFSIDPTSVARVKAILEELGLDTSYAQETATVYYAKTIEYAGEYGLLIWDDPASVRQFFEFLAGKISPSGQTNVNISASKDEISSAFRTFNLNPLGASEEDLKKAFAEEIKKLQPQIAAGSLEENRQKADKLLALKTARDICRSYIQSRGPMGGGMSDISRMVRNNNAQQLFAYLQRTYGIGNPLSDSHAEAIREGLRQANRLDVLAEFNRLVPAPAAGPVARFVAVPAPTGRTDEMSDMLIEVPEVPPAVNWDDMTRTLVESGVNTQDAEKIVDMIRRAPTSEWWEMWTIVKYHIEVAGAAREVYRSIGDIKELRTVAIPISKKFCGMTKETGQAKYQALAQQLRNIFRDRGYPDNVTIVFYDADSPTDLISKLSMIPGLKATNTFAFLPSGIKDIENFKKLATVVQLDVPKGAEGGYVHLSGHVAVGLAFLDIIRHPEKIDIEGRYISSLLYALYGQSASGLAEKFAKPDQIDSILTDMRAGKLIFILPPLSRKDIDGDIKTHLLAAVATMTSL